MIAEALGWKVDKFEQQMKPIVTSVDRKSPYGFAKAGDVAGVNMTGQGYCGGQLKIDMYHPQQTPATTSFSRAHLLSIWRSTPRSTAA